MRRLSGGGAVYHDMGNLNFTFLLTKDNYNVDKQLEVITMAVNNLGIPAIKSGRNDITVEGRKFSGNAFYSSGDKCYHHGTILVDVDMPSLSKYLNVSKAKLKSKGVDSVKSRVTNLNEYMPDLTLDRLRNELIISYGEIYGLEPSMMELSSRPIEDLMSSEERFSSWEWNYGRKIEFSDSFERRFSWGDFDLQLVVEGGIIKDCRIYSDALDTTLFVELPKHLIGCTFATEALADALNGIKVEMDNNHMIEDIIQFISEEI